MIRVGITGQPGFVGTHLANFIRLKTDQCTLVAWEDRFFDSPDLLERFAGDCDVIVHLAAVNRHNDPGFIFETNVGLVRKLIAAIDASGSRPNLVFASSIQETMDNPYGRSKAEGRKLLAEWAAQHDTLFTGFVIPNVFGPFSAPFHNSFVSTFCHLLSTGGNPEVHGDATVPLIYINQLVENIYRAVIGAIAGDTVDVAPDQYRKVSEILSDLTRFRDEYLGGGIVPKLTDSFDVNLFNTYRSYIPMERYPFALEKKADQRGFLVEAVKTHTEGQVFYSLTKPGVTRGNHYHRRKIERFVILEGNAVIRLRKIGTDKIYEYPVSGDNPVFIDMPVHYTHHFENTGDSDVIMLFWTNELYNPADPDTYFEVV